MAFFDADLPVNNSKLPELEILGGKVQVEEKKGVFFFSKDDITIELTGTFQETKQGIDGTVHQLVCKTGDDEPTWDISGLEYDFDKLFTKIDDGKLDKVIEEMFEKKDLIWGSHFDDKLYGFKGTDVVVGWGGNDWIDGGKGKDKLIGDSSEEDKSTGGFGDDTFAFDQTLKSSNVDKITDFHIEHDTIDLKRKIFSEFDKGKLHEAELHLRQDRGRRRCTDHLPRRKGPSLLRCRRRRWRQGLEVRHHRQGQGPHPRQLPRVLSRGSADERLARLDRDNALVGRAGERAIRRPRLAQGRRPSGLQAFRLCRHGQDDARPSCRRRC